MGVYQDLVDYCEKKVVLRKFLNITLKINHFLIGGKRQRLHCRGNKPLSSVSSERIKLLNNINSIWNKKRGPKRDR